MNHIGLFGGTFNPIHFGHLRTIREVQEGFGLDRVFLIPSALPPHKSPEGIADAGDRLEMTGLAVSDSPDVVVSDIELKRAGPSYTIDTVRYFKSLLSRDTRIYFILGLDAFLEIGSWRYSRELFQEIPFIVMARPDPGGDGERRWERVGEYLKTEISDRYQLSLCRRYYSHPETQPVYIFNVTLLDISGTKIRELLRKGKTIQFLMPDKVEKFIKTRGLYL